MRTDKETMSDKDSGSFFVVSGENTALAAGELRSLVRTYHPDASIEQVDQRMFLVHDEINVRKIVERAVSVKKAGKLLSTSGSTGFEIDGHFKQYRTFACRTINLSQKRTDTETVRLLGHYVKEKCPWMSVSLENPDVVILNMVTDNSSVIGMMQNHIPKKIINPRDRPFFHPSALNPKLSRLMVNLTMAKEDDLLLDPFCGTGSILNEALDMGINAIGCDLSTNMCRGAIQNVGGKCMIINSDALSLPLQSEYIDVIATDLPYGTGSSTMKRDAKGLLQEFVSFLKSKMKGKRCCFMCKKGDDELFESVLEEYEIYEHSGLTRKLMVLCS